VAANSWLNNQPERELKASPSSAAACGDQLLLYVFQQALRAE